MRCLPRRDLREKVNGGGRRAYLYASSKDTGVFGVHWHRGLLSMVLAFEPSHDDACIHDTSERGSILNQAIDLFSMSSAG